MTSSPTMSGLKFTRSYFTRLSGLGFGAMLEPDHHLQLKVKIVPEFIHFSWFGLPYQRKPLTTLCETTASDCGHVSANNGHLERVW